MTADPYEVAAEHFDLLIADAWQVLRPALALALAAVDPAAGPVLDLGAGTGMGTKVIAELAPGSDILAVEPSRSLRVGLFGRLADNPRLRDRVTVLPTDALGAELPARIGGVVAMNMVGHLAPPEREELWRRLAERLAPGAPLVVNLQPPARAEAVPETVFASVPVGGRVYRGRGSAIPAGPSKVTWRMAYQTLVGTTVVSEDTVDHDWWVVDEERLVTELAVAGLTCEPVADGVYVATRISTTSP